MDALAGGPRGGGLADRMAHSVFALDLYEGLDADQVRSSWRDSIDRILGGIRERRVPGADDDDSAVREVGVTRSLLGLGVAEIIRTTAFHERLIMSIAAELAPVSEFRDEFLVELLLYKQAWTTWSVQALAAGHREAEIGRLRHLEERRSAFVRAVLAGTVTRSEVVARFEEYELDPDTHYRAFRIRTRSDDELRVVRAEVRGTGRPAGLLAVVDGDVAGFTKRLGRREMTSTVGLSAASPVADLADGFRRATRALEAAVARGATGVVAFEEVALLAAVDADQDVTTMLVQRYVAPLRGGREAGVDVLRTVAVYLDRGRSVSTTAQEVFVHANTVRYRLARFEEVTGASLADARTVVEVHWALQAQSGALTAAAAGD